MTRVDYDPEQLGPAFYPLLTSIVVPRPIAWVSTRSAAGVDNLAPHSFFTVSAVDPPVVQFTSVGDKDSLRNVLETGEFAIGLSDEANAERVNVTGTDFPAGISEFDVAGLTREPSAKISVPRVAESPVAIECRLLQTLPLGNGTVVFGQVVWVAVSERVLRDGRPAIDLLRPVARLGADEWSTIGEVVSRRRVPWSEVNAGDE